MKRRTFLRTAGAAGAAGLAGCTSSEPSGTTTGTTSGGSETLRVATYQPFVDAPSVSPGPWIREQFAARTGADVEWLTPESGLNQFVQRAQNDVPIAADVYVGVNADDLVRVDEQLPDQRLFDSVSASTMPNAAAVEESLEFDPEGRAIPFDTGIISLVYDAGAMAEPETFADLTSPAFADTLLLQNAQTSDPGRAFLLWTVAAMGTEGYLDYWADLVANGARIVGDWNAAYTAFANGERPAVVSYSTDQVYAHRNDQDLQAHQIAFLNDQGYAVPEGMARFADTDRPALAAEFMDFLLAPETQAEIAVRNVAFPASTAADPPADFEEFAHRPGEVLTHSYDELVGSLDTWVEDWARQIVSG